MGAVLFLIVVAVLFMLISNFDNSKKETTRERIGDAVSKTAYDAAETVSDISNKITQLAEPADKKKIRQAKELLSQKNWEFTHCEHTKSYDLNRILEVNESFREALSTLGLNEDEWKVFAKDLFFRSKIIEYSFLNDITHTKETELSIRKSIIENENIGTFSWGEIHDEIIEALNYFNIDSQEWVEYGYVVVLMHHLCEDDFHKKFRVS